MHGCQSDYIVTFYGAFLNEHNDVIMCMEYMDVGYVQIVQPRALKLTDRVNTGPSTGSRAFSGLFESMC